MTAGRGEGNTIVAGGPARHVSVLRGEALAALAAHAGGQYLDGTFGAGGYTRAILEVPGTRVLALDRDPDCVRQGAQMVSEMGGRLILAEARFGNLDVNASRFGFIPLDGVVLDVGVSSMQLDEAGRGFSLRKDGPLDMRMERGNGPTAADILNGEAEATIAAILFHFGEEKLSRRIARAIVTDRARAPFRSTRQLAELVARIVPSKPQDLHPATRTFQALRIAVNDELGELVHGLEASERVLKPGGRLVVVSFHSLEDRIVKQFFASRSGRAASSSRHLPDARDTRPSTFNLDRRQPITPSEGECRENPRSRSAKLRYATRTEATPRGNDPDLHALATLPLVNRKR